MATDETPRRDFLLTKHKSFRRIFRLLNSDKTPQNLAGASVKFFVKPWNDSGEFEINTAGASDQKLFVEPQAALTADLDESTTSQLDLDDASLFAERGFVEIGDEVIGYDKRPRTTSLVKLTRGVRGTTPAAHAATDSVRALGQIMIYIADEKIDDFEWRGADHRLQLEDSQGDQRPLFFGQLKFEKGVRA